MKDFNLVVWASGGGGNFQALIDAQEKIGFEITHLITDRECGAIERAHQHGISSITLDRKTLGNTMFWDEVEKAIPENTDLIVLAGFIPIVPAHICHKWNHKIINTHPSLLPKHGGKGMVGVKVQEAVLASEDKIAGCTIHFVSPEIDGGDIILQRSVPVIGGESAWDLGGRVFKEENKALVEVVRLLKEKNLNG